MWGPFVSLLSCLSLLSSSPWCWSSGTRASARGSVRARSCAEAGSLHGTCPPELGPTHRWAEGDASCGAVGRAQSEFGLVHRHAEGGAPRGTGGEGPAGTRPGAPTCRGQRGTGGKGPVRSNPSTPMRGGRRHKRRRRLRVGRSSARARTRGGQRFARRRWVEEALDGSRNGACAWREKEEAVVGGTR